MKETTSRNFDSETLSREPEPDSSAQDLACGPEDSTWTVEGSGGELVVAQARAAGFQSGDGRAHRPGLSGDEGCGARKKVGAKLGAPSRQVVCFIGDGAVMYCASGFWAQACYGIPVLSVVANNHNSRTVRLVAHGYKGRMSAGAHYDGTYVGEPDIDFVALAKNQGVSGEKVDDHRRLEPAIELGKTATRDGKPYLVEVTTARWGRSGIRVR
jgi:thiamine pyrophosphate-dependent acetolactate synthase large subunit-like protein